MGKAKKHAGLAVLLAVLLAGCQSGPQRRPQTVIDGFAQGGTYHIVLVGDSTSGGLKGQLDSLLWRVDNSMSLYNPTSRLSRINRGETDTLDRFIANCIRTADTISRESGGRYDITIKPLTAAYGFTGDRPVQQPNVDSLLQFIGYDKIRIDGCRLVKKDRLVRNYLGLALIPQAGVAIGLAALGARTLGGTMGSDLQTIILASSVLYELIGPGCAKLALYLSRSYSTKLEDVAVVAEVTETGEQKSDAQLLIERIRKIQSELPPLESDVSEEEAAFTEAAEEQLAQTQAQRRYFYLRR